VELISAKDYAAMKGVSGVAVHKWLATGKLGPEGDAWNRNGARYLIDPEKADVYLSALPVTMQRSAPTARDAKPAIDHEAAKISREYTRNKATGAGYDAYLKKLEYERKIGRYVLSDEVKQEAYTLYRMVRDSILNIPDRISPIVAAEADTEKVREILTSELTTALEALSTSRVAQ
jgi:hypothetical protein